jgi:AcrR family transcriptional regulator
MPRSRSTAVTRRPGGRSARVVAAVLNATLEELGRVGFARLRVDAIAAQSGVNKTTVYRRWTNKSALACAALKTVGGPPHDVNSGCVRTDLAASFRAATRGWTTPRGRAILRVISAERADPTVERLARMLRERHVASRRLMIERAIARGELPQTTDINLLLEVLTGAVHARVRHQASPIDPAWLARVVDFALAAARSSAHDDRIDPAVFSSPVHSSDLHS